jgi:hypothetical protein
MVAAGAHGAGSRAACQTLAPQKVAHTAQAGKGAAGALGSDSQQQASGVGTLPRGCVEKKGGVPHNSYWQRSQHDHAVLHPAAGCVLVLRGADA